MNKYEKQHQRDMVRYAKQIDAIYEAAAKEAARMGVSVEEIMKRLDKDMFSFDDYPLLADRLDKLMKQLHDEIEICVVNGVEKEWTLANNKHNELCNRVFGDRIGRLTDAQYQRYYNSNGAALDTFKSRQVAGLNLSDRVWKYTDGFKTEIENALSVSLGSGKSAERVASELKQYLQYPDKLFRRVRNGKGELVPSKAMSEFHSGRGVYKSSYKNARRLAVTETNIAFRTADHLRVQDEDFVVGIKIVLSNNHTCKGVKGVFIDICDQLQGKYPKDFKFTGWHPHCRCHIETILKTDAEIDADFEKILNGKEPTSGSVNEVKGTPDNFNKWLNDNEERIANAKNKPYFINDNPNYIYTTKPKDVVIQKQTTTKVVHNNGDSVIYNDEDIIRAFAPKKIVDASKMTDKELLVRLQEMQNSGLININLSKVGTQRYNLENTYNSIINNKQLPFGNRVSLIDRINDALSRLNISELSDFDKSNIVSFINQYEKLCKSTLGKDICRSNNALEGILNYLSLVDKKVDFSKVSIYTPVDLLSKGKWLGVDTVVDKRIFDLLGEFVPVKITTNDTCFSPSLYCVKLNTNDSRYSSILYRRKTIYHEYGHAIDNIHSLCTRKEVADIMSKYNIIYSDNNDALYKKLASDMYAKYSCTLTASGRAKYGVKDNNDLCWQFNAFSDTIQALNKSTKYGTVGGHNDAYWNIPTKTEKEFLAHCFENFFEGNTIFKEFDSNMYNEMIQMLKTILNI